jgi:hypothetical protein
MGSNLTETISWSELAWTLVSLAGFLVALWELHEAMVDVVVLRVLGRDGVPALVARGHVRTEILRLMKLALFSFVGALLMTQPPLTFQADSLVFMIVAFSLLSVAVLLTGGALWDRLDRIRLLHTPDHSGRSRTQADGETPTAPVEPSPS